MHKITNHYLTVKHKMVKESEIKHVEHKTWKKKTFYTIDKQYISRAAAAFTLTV